MLLFHERAVFTIMEQHGFLFHQTSHSNARSISDAEQGVDFKKYTLKTTFSCRTNKLCFLFKPLFLLTKLKSRHAERTQFEGYSVAKGRVSLLKASGYPVFKMHLLKVAKVNILCLSCTQNLLQSRQPKCTQLCLCSGAVVLKK